MVECVSFVCLLFSFWNWPGNRSQVSSVTGKRRTTDMDVISLDYTTLLSSDSFFL